MKKIIFTILLLAVASLGLALPSPLSPAAPSVLPTTLDSTQAITDDLKVSPKCATAIFSIATSPEFLKCIPIAAFVPILPIVTDPNFLVSFAKDPAGTFTKIEPAFVQFSSGFCPAPKCSDQGVQGAIKILSDGCSDDLKANTVVQMIFGFTVFYPAVHDIICFKDKAEFCWDESLKVIFGLPKSPITITGDPFVDSIAVADPSVICTKCNKQITNTFFNFMKGNDLALKVLEGAGIAAKTVDSMKLGAIVKCGLAFEDGKVPPS